MDIGTRELNSHRTRQTCLLALLMAVALSAFSQSQASSRSEDFDTERPRRDYSQFVPLESEAYTVVVRLAALGYIDSAMLGLRPWTRSEFARLIEEAEDNFADREQTDIEVARLVKVLHAAFSEETGQQGPQRFRIDDVYVRFGGIAGTPLTDSYHFGETLTNDYGRPYARGLSWILGTAASGELGRFAWSFRGEYQRAPGQYAISDSARNIIATADGVPIQPVSSPSSTHTFRVQEATVSTTMAGVQFTLGKQSFWWGTGESGAMILSNNAEPFYAIRISRSTPVQLPSVFSYLGPLRFDSFFGRLEHHHFPEAPFFYGQKFSFKPTPNLEFGFSRTVVFAGQGVTPLTFLTFLNSFFSTSSGTASGFDPRRNPGARHSGFDFSYRWPGLRRWGVVLYSESVAHDDVSPISAPRRASINPGIYVARLPFLPRFDFRAEAVNTDPPTSRSNGGKFLYWEGLYRDAYVNSGNLMGNWVGREGKGGQAWVGFSPTVSSRIELGYRRSKLAKDFFPGGGTQNDVGLTARWLLGSSVQMRGLVQFEHWNIPVLDPFPQSNATVQFELHWLHPIR